MPRVALLSLLLLALLAPAAGAGLGRSKDAPTAKAMKSATRSFAVFRARKAAGDRIPGASKLESRRIGTVAGAPVFAAVVVDKVQLRVGRFIASTPASKASRNEVALLVPQADGSVATAVLVADGARDARRVAADGTTTALTVRRNAILDRSPAGGAIEWTRKDGSKGSYALKKLPF
ncbi:MAG: hypothetical protein HZB46_17960 [Solirubrobacterales bacterium]|nr:hypothetical protein [Solirubrobacterales bacterium]